MNANGNTKMLKIIGLCILVVSIFTGYVVANDLKRQSGDVKGWEYTHRVEQAQHALERRIGDKLDAFSLVQTSMAKEQGEMLATLRYIEKRV